MIIVAVNFANVMLTCNTWRDYIQSDSFDTASTVEAHMSL